MRLSVILLFPLLQLVCSLSLPIHNGLYSASSEYTVTIQIGTPPRPFEVQVDTGSVKLAIPCSGCTTCHHGINPLFDVSQSSTYSSVACTDTSVSCDDCSISSFGPGKCLLNSSYMDNSTIQGQMISDVFTIPGLSTPIRTELGCIQNQNELMAAAGVDGIWGVGKSSVDQDGSARRADQLIAAISNQAGSSQRMLSLCLAVQGGVMSIGAIDNSLHTKPGITIPYDDAASDSIGKSIGKISVGSFVITQNGAVQLPQIIIDSGTTSSFFSPNIYEGIINAVNHHCKQLGDSCIEQPLGKEKCYVLSDYQAAFRQIPPISISFNGVELLWHAEEYLLVKDSQSSQYCIYFTATSGQGSFILGDDFMLNKDIVYGEHSIVIYPQSKCGGQVVTYAYGSTRRLQEQKAPLQKQQLPFWLPFSFIVLIFVIFICLLNKIRQNRLRKQQTGFNSLITSIKL